jgi:hypothetical protein
MDNFNLLDISVRLAYNAVTALFIIRFVYYPREKKREYLFTFVVFNMMIFFVCTFLKYVLLDIKFAFGLFAVFSVLRFRTEPIPIREMTYQFLVITLGALNGMADVGTWHPELLFLNLVILAAVAAFDGKILLKQEYSQTVKYDRIELILPSEREALMADLRLRTGLDIYRLKIGKIDFLRDAAEIVVFYRGGKRAGLSAASMGPGIPRGGES